MARTSDIAKARGVEPRRSSRSGRPGDGQAQQAVLEAAEKLLGEKTLKEISVGEVIEEAGVSRATFYFYFSSKYSVLAALVAGLIEGLEQRAAGLVSREGGPLEADVRVAVSSQVDLWRTHGAVLRAAAENWRSDPELEQIWTAMIARLTEIVGRQVEAAQAGGRSPGGPDPKALGAVLIWMTERCSYVHSVEAEPALASRENLTEALVRAWMGVLDPGSV